MKKALPVFLSVLIIETMLSMMFSIPVHAEDFDYIENGVKYQLFTDKTAVIVGCDDNISEITISDKLKNGYNVEIIESEAFIGNLDLESFVCEADLKSVGDYAFESCAHLKTASFKGKVEKIGSGAFSMCSSLSLVELPGSLREIGDGAFLMDRELTELAFPADLEILGEYAFAMSGLQKADMNCKLKLISDRAFLKCENLTEVNLPPAAENIEAYAFYHCENLSLINIPETVDVIGRSSFEGCPITNVQLNCSQIGERAFLGCYDMQNITFSDKPISIFPHAFENAHVDKFVLPDNAELQECALAAVNTNEFEVSETNEKYTVKDGVLFSKDMKTLVAFPSDREPEKGVYTIPEEVEAIAPHAFDTAWRLTEIIIPKTVNEIGEYAFYQSGLKKIKLPDSVKIIKEGAFGNCQSLESVDLGKAEEICAHAFQNCNEFTLNLPETIANIEPLAFAHSDIRLESNGSYKVFDGVLFADDGRRLVYYPQYLEDEAYTIPDGVEEISDKAFTSNASVKCVYIPSSLVYIGEKGIGYTFDPYDTFERPLLTEGFVLIGNASEEVKWYARDNNIGIFTSNILSQNISEATLAGNKTAKFLIKNTDPADVIYTSNDERIATVSPNGTITAVGKGTTYVTAAVGMTYFKCKVNVTSGGSIVYTGFDESKYVKIDRDSYKQWESHYRDNNPYLTEKFRDGNSALAISAYQSQNYYEAMFGADAADSHYHETGAAMFGEGYEKMIQALNHACDTELLRYHNTDNMQLFSGADYYTTSLITQGMPATVSNMRSAVGTSFTYPMFASTTLDETVSHRFYSGSDGVVMMIYADKEALDQCISGYIGAYHGDIEYELLMSHGVTFEVIDAGVRYVSSEGFREDDEKLDTFERYVKLKVLYDKTEPDITDDDSSETEDSPQNIESESSDSSSDPSSVQSGTTDSSRNTSSVQSRHADSSRNNDSVQSENSDSSVWSNNTETSISESSAVSNNTKAQNSNNSIQSSSSAASSENKNVLKVLTGYSNSYIVITFLIIMGAACAMVLFTKERDN